MAEALADQSDDDVAGVLTLILGNAYKEDPYAARELCATMVRDIRAGERIRVGRNQ
jgi:hypothetical protein